MSKATTAGVENNQVTAKVGEVVPKCWLMRYMYPNKGKWHGAAFMTESEMLQAMHDMHRRGCFAHVLPMPEYHIPGEGATNGE